MTLNICFVRVNNIIFINNDLTFCYSLQCAVVTRRVTLMFFIINIQTHRRRTACPSVLHIYGISTLFKLWRSVSSWLFFSETRTRRRVAIIYLLTFYSARTLDNWCLIIIIINIVIRILIANDARARETQFDYLIFTHVPRLRTSHRNVNDILPP